MRVTVSAGGTFHAFHLAAQLEQHGLLYRLITTHGRLYRLITTRRWPRDEDGGVSRRRIKANLLPEIFQQVPHRLRLPVRGDYQKAESFDRWAARHVDGCDLLVGFAVFSLYSMRRAKALRIKTVLERASSHILHQQALLEEEGRRFGYAPPPIDPRLVDKQLEEYKVADYIAVPSTFVYKTFVERGFPPARLINVPLGVDIERFTPGRKADDAFRVLAAGLSLQKGTPYILEAVAGIGRPDVELVFLGNMDYDVGSVLAKYEVRKYEGRYQWPGHLTQARLIEHMRQGSVFVQPSVQDGFGMMIVQAMAVGLPVICTTNTAGPDLVRDGVEGFIVPIRDPGAIRDRLRYLAEHPDLRRRMGEAAAARAREFDWNGYGDRISAEYGRIAAGASGDPGRSRAAAVP